MLRLDPDTLLKSQRAFQDPAPTTLADLRKRAQADPALGSLARRDLISAIRRTEEWFSTGAEQIDATPPRLQKLFGSTSAKSLGVSEKTFANVRSLISKALRYYVAPDARVPYRVPLSSEWAALLSRIDVKFQRCGLNRLARYCSALNIAPREVNSATLQGLLEALEAEQIVKRPKDILYNTISNWNRSLRTVKGWPQVRLSSPSTPQRFSLPLGHFPASFQEDVARWCRRISSPDPFDESSPIKPLRSATAKHRVMQFRIFGAALASSGQVPLENITNIGILVAPDNFRAALRVIYDRLGRTQTLYNLACSMRLVGKHYCDLDQATLEQLGHICRKLNADGRRTITNRNRDRLRQFDEPGNVTRLLQLPRMLLAAAKRKQDPYRSAKCVEQAVIIGLLIHCGLRLRSLRLIEATDVRRVGTSKYHLHVPAAKQKTAKDLEFELEGETAAAITLFMTKQRSMLRGAQGPYLFPGRSGGPRSDAAMYATICRVARRYAGLKMNPHLFRHVLAKIVVETDPTAYQAVSQLLGHNGLSTTMAHYLGTETRAAGKHIDTLLAGLTAKS